MGEHFLAYSLKTCLALAFFLLALPARAQETVPDTLSTDATEAVLESAAEGASDSDELAERLGDLLTEPLDLNTASTATLAEIPSIGALLAARIVRYRTANGRFGSLPELQLVEGITPELYRELRPFLRLGADPERTGPMGPPPFSFQRAFAYARLDAIQRFTRRLDVGRGYDEGGAYAGGPERLYTRLRLRTEGPKGGRLLAGLTLEKDPGEQFGFSAERPTGFDHATGHIAITGAGKLDALVLGDYVIEYGQGLAFWRGSAFGKSRETVGGVIRRGRGIRPYASTDEIRFFRGAAASYQITSSLRVDAFGAAQALDARDADAALVDSTEGFGVVGLAEDGLHRTETELSRRNALDRRFGGGALTYERGIVQLGLAAAATSFERPFSPDSSRVDNRFAFRGKEHQVATLFGQIDLDDVTLFGEVAQANTGGASAIGGVALTFDRTLDLLFVARHYPATFPNLYGSGFGERSGTTQNESGIYAGVSIRPAKYWSVRAYFDQYRFPFARFGVPGPSTGADALLYVENRPRRWITVSAQLRSETRGVGTTFTDGAGREVDGVGDQTRQTARLEGSYSFSSALRLRARIEGAAYRGTDRERTTGVIVFQDIRYQPSPALRFDARYALFDSESFGARLFAYEYDLLYAFAVPAFSGTGQRWYVLTTWKPKQGWSLQAKYATTRFENRDEIGSGNDALEGNVLREVRLQLRVRL